MKPGTATLFLIIFILLVPRASAQMLSEKLATEDPAKLAAEARKNGNIVRGAILFHQGNINCAKCHRNKAERDRIGPDLSRMDQKTTDAFIVESILNPSKAIKKGFETVNVTTMEGQVTNGLLVKENDQHIVIRDGQKVDKLITIRREDIDEIGPGNTSSMPDRLVDEFKSRQHFLDLVRYVLDVKERGPQSNVVTSESEQRYELKPELNGIVQMQQLNCVACHRSEAISTFVAAKKAPKLKWAAKWTNPERMAKFIADPQFIKPGTTMPHMLGHLNRESREQAAQALTEFILSYAKNEFRGQTIDADAVPRGFELFHSVGCVACHAPRDRSAKEKPTARSTALGNLSQKFTVDGLVEFLENPHTSRPSGRMPNMQLKRREALNISNYLLQAADKVVKPSKRNLALVEKGKQLFTQLRCNQCHTDLASDNAALKFEMPLAKLRPERGCLSDKPGPWPKFGLTDAEQTHILTALKHLTLKRSIEEKIQVSLVAFNCTACHDRAGLGGVTADRSPHFQTTNMNLGEQGRIPPTLTGVGAKLKSKWMRDVVVNGRVVRPYMKTRMPQFGEENVGHLVQLFQAADQLPKTRFAEFTDQKKMRETGLHLAGNKGLNCVACHTYKYKISDTMPAVDLTEMTDRLKKDWFYRYMLAPQEFAPNTVMPSFWPQGKAIRKDLSGTPELQIEALWQFLIDGRQARAPSGVVREPLEIIVTTEAVMLRRSYPGIGKRGIGVGYPRGVNLAFDAEQMRLGMIWKGKFVDPAGVWTGQGSGNVRPMGKMIHFAKGPALDDRSKPWAVDEGRPPNHQFKGYTLDKSRRPTFRYRFETVEVEDFFSQAEDQSTKQISLRRSVSLLASKRRDDLRFRIASGKKITKFEDRIFEIDGRFKVRLISSHLAEIKKSDDGMALQMTLDLQKGDREKLEFEYLWE